MKRQKASNIYFAVTHFTIQCSCCEKIYMFAFDVKIDHQLIISPGPLLQKLKWLFPPLAHLSIVFVLRTERMAVLKKRVCSAPKVGAAETLTPASLKQNNTTQLTQSSDNGVIASTEGALGSSPVVQQNAWGQNWYLNVSLLQSPKSNSSQCPLVFRVISPLSSTSHSHELSLEQDRRTHKTQKINTPRC